jgi:hypothetical protein
VGGGKGFLTGTQKSSVTSRERKFQREKKKKNFVGPKIIFFFSSFQKFLFFFTIRCTEKEEEENRERLHTDVFTKGGQLCDQL